MPTEQDVVALQQRVATLEIQFGHLAESIAILAKAHLTAAETSTRTNTSIESVLSIFNLLEQPSEPGEKIKTKKAKSKSKAKSKRKKR
jgi:hypothetical protein